MNRFARYAGGLTSCCLAIAGCDSVTAPSTVRSVFVVALASGAAVPEPQGSERGSTGMAQIALTRSRDENGSGDAAIFIELSGVPATALVSSAHLHIGRRGDAGPTVVDIPIPGSPIRPSAAGRLTIDVESLGVNVGLVQSTENNPDIVYLDVHSQQNPSGFLRGQLEPASQ